MNMQSNAVPQASPQASSDSHAIAPADIPASRRLYWSVRRELWENRSIYIAPLAVAALVLVGFLISAAHVRHTTGFELTLDNHRRIILLQRYDVAALLIMGTTFIVAFFYCLDALYGERRDRSVLFWKSLPVSDVTSVLAKASVPLVILPLLTFVITVVTQSIMLLLHATILLGSGVSVGTLWDHVPLGQMWVMLLYHLVAIHALWYAPIFGWLLLVSAWARRAPFLWAILPPLAIAVVEKIAFNTTYFATMLKSRLGGGEEGAPFTPTMNMGLLTHLNPGHFLASPGLWIGLAVAAAFLAGAVRLRRSGGPI